MSHCVICCQTSFMGLNCECHCVCVCAPVYHACVLLCRCKVEAALELLDMMVLPPPGLFADDNQ